MRLALVAGVLAAFALLPYILNGVVFDGATPRHLIRLGVISLVGVAASFLSLLGAVAAPEHVQVLDLPRAIDLCVAAASRLLAHPASHWPAIFAALVLVATLLRLLYGFAAATWEARRSSLPGRMRPDELAARRRYGLIDDRVRILSTGTAVAYTTRILRPQVVVSTGLLDRLEPDKRLAVLAHELGHTGRWHMPLLVGARAISRAFGFLPPVRIAVDQLMAGLEAAADDAAARAVGNPVVVAGALASVVAMSRAPIPPQTLGIGDRCLAYRISRLVGPRPRRRDQSISFLSGVLVGAMTMSLVFGWTLHTAGAQREARGVALHDTCHQPHELAPVR